MRTTPFLPVAVFSALLLAAPAIADEVTLEGQVLDAAGKPVAGAVVAGNWAQGQPGGVSETDAEGRFTITVEIYGEMPIVLMAKDKERKRGAVSKYAPGTFGEKRTLTLGPLVRVHGTMDCTKLGAKPWWTMAYASVGDGPALASFESDAAKFEFLLPKGTYRFDLDGSNVVMTALERTLTGAEGEGDLGTTDFEPTKLALMFGKHAAPLHVTEARGIATTVNWAALKGKGGGLEFWGHW